MFMPLSAPASMEKEHQDIWQLLVRVQNLSGKTGSIAEKLAKDLKTHIDKEENMALPLLGLLQDLVSGKLSKASARRASLLCSKFEKEYPGMLTGHKELSKMLERLRKVGAEEGHLTAVRFAEALEKHSQEEEEVLYPAAILAGRTAAKQVKTKS
jgi:hemerythrin-like domain-containing protein